MIPGSTDQKLLNCGSLIEQVYPDRHERNQDSSLKSQHHSGLRRWGSMMMIIYTIDRRRGLPSSTSLATADQSPTCRGVPLP